jgi:hypothetical protein
MMTGSLICFNGVSTRLVIRQYIVKLPSEKKNPQPVQLEMYSAEDKKSFSATGPYPSVHDQEKAADTTALDYAQMH